MSRQVEGSLPARERTSEPPALSADALDRSIEALRETLERAETRWQQLEARLADQDRAIRELKDELSKANSKRFRPADLHVSGVPELTEIVTPVATAHAPVAGDLPATADTQAANATPPAVLKRIADLESPGDSDS
jgi:hypothetical protein